MFQYSAGGEGLTAAANCDENKCRSLRCAMLRIASVGMTTKQQQEHKQVLRLRSPSHGSGSLRSG